MKKNYKYTQLVFFISVFVLIFGASIQNKNNWRKLMISKQPINPNRIRQITGSFSWIDHRLITDGFIQTMEPAEMLLYFFLILVGDKNGVSFYSYDKICALLKIDVDRFIGARERLIKRSLIDCDNGRFQVLQLPDKPIQISQPPKRMTPGNQPIQLKKIFQQLAEVD